MRYNKLSGNPRSIVFMVRHDAQHHKGKNALAIRSILGRRNNPRPKATITVGEAMPPNGTCSFAPPGLGGILLELLTDNLRHGLRSFACFAGYASECDSSLDGEGLKGRNGARLKIGRQGSHHWEGASRSAPTTIVAAAAACDHLAPQSAMDFQADMIVRRLHRLVRWEYPSRDSL